MPTKKKADTKPPEVSSDELESVAAVRIAIRRFLAATDDVTETNGLTPRQYDLLALLHRPTDGNDLTATEIADLLCLSRSATTELITRAADAGLLNRSSDEGDMRVKRLTPTAEGNKRFYAAVRDLRDERNRLVGLLRTAAALAAAFTALM
jgi:DNA-binding MarR family transcriptional regulator